MAMPKSVSANDLFLFHPLVKCPLPDLVPPEQARAIAAKVKADTATNPDAYLDAYNTAIREAAPCVYIKPVAEVDGTAWGLIRTDATRATERSDLQLRMVMKYVCNERGERLFTSANAEEQLHAMPSSTYYDMVMGVVATLNRIPAGDIDSDPTGPVPVGDSDTE